MIDNLDIEFYKNYYEDVKNLSNIQIIKQYMKIGIKENRYINREDYKNKTGQNYFDNLSNNNNISSINNIILDINLINDNILKNISCINVNNTTNTFVDNYNDIINYKNLINNQIIQSNNILKEIQNIKKILIILSCNNDSYDYISNINKILDYNNNYYNLLIVSSLTNNNIENYINILNKDNIIFIKKNTTENIIKFINKLIIKYNILEDYDYFIWLLDNKHFDINILKYIDIDVKISEKNDIIFLPENKNIFIINKRLYNIIDDIDDILIKIYLMIDKYNIKLKNITKEELYLMINDKYIKLILNKKKILLYDNDISNNDSNIINISKNNKKILKLKQYLDYELYINNISLKTRYSGILYQNNIKYNKLDIIIYGNNNKYLDDNIILLNNLNNIDVNIIINKEYSIIEEIKKKYENIIYSSGDINNSFNKIRNNSNYILLLDSNILIKDEKIIYNMINNITEDIKCVGYYGGIINNEYYIDGNNLNDDYEYIINKDNKYIKYNILLIESKIIKKINLSNKYDDDNIKQIDLSYKINNYSIIKKLIVEDNKIKIDIIDKKNNKNKIIKNSLYFFTECIDFSLDKSLVLNNIIKKMDYINLDHYDKIYNNNNRINNIINNKFENEYKKILDDILKENIDNKEKILTISKIIYPYTGGGEEWLRDITEILDNYYHIGICFYDRLNEKSFNKINIIKDNKFMIIQMPLDYEILILIIKYIKPKCINHQGDMRYNLCIISYLLDIKFITGYCFWNDIIDFKNDNCFNINMINKDYKKDDKYYIIDKYSINYCVSDFMYNILKNKLNIDIPIIYSITCENKYKINKKNNRYVSILNSNPLKGGQELLYLLENLDINIPILAVLSEYDNNHDKLIKQAFNNRNNKNNINILYHNKIDVKYIYENSEIILIPSIVDETFCKVAYESMKNNLKIISYNNGNLQYLLNNYPNNYFIESSNNYNKYQDWTNMINNIYNKDIINYNFKFNNDYNDDICYIKEKLINLINSNKKLIIRDTIGIFCPFYDQGLGIQAREYYEFLQLYGYKVAIFSHKAYIANQVDKNEWNYNNVYYSNNYRYMITLNEIIEFVFKYNIKIIIIPEICSDKIFNIINYFKLLNVQVLGVVNIEISNYTNMNKYDIIDIIIANNYSSYIILKTLYGNKVKLLEFDNYYFNKHISKPIKLNTTIKFITLGGLNSYIRKNIHHTYDIFKKLEKETEYDFKLNIYIQGDDGIMNVNMNKTDKIDIYYNNYSYKQIIDIIRDNHIYIHLGDHEGLGLGFYEALNNNLPVITLDTYPNCEYIVHENNGFIINSSFIPMNDNHYGIVNKGLLDLNDYYNLLLKILHPNYRLNLINIINKNKHIHNNYKNNFINILN